MRGMCGGLLCPLISAAHEGTRSYFLIHETGCSGRGWQYVIPCSINRAGRCRLPCSSRSSSSSGGGGGSSSSRSKQQQQQKQQQQRGSSSSRSKQAAAAAAAAAARASYATNITNNFTNLLGDSCGTLCRKKVHFPASRTLGCASEKVRHLCHKGKQKPKPSLLPPAATFQGPHSSPLSPHYAKRYPFTCSLSGLRRYGTLYLPFPAPPCDPPFRGGHAKGLDVWRWAGYRHAKPKASTTGATFQVSCFPMC